MSHSFIIFNSPMPTTAPPVKQPTGVGTRSMLQLVAASGSPFWVLEWGVSFDGITAATPILSELIETGTVAASMSTAHVASGIMPYGSVADAAASPLSIGATNLTGFATAAVSEGTITATRLGDAQSVPPSSLYAKQLPQGREFFVPGGRVCRIRTTAGASVGCTAYAIVSG